MKMFPLDKSENGLHLEFNKADDDGFFIIETKFPESKVYVYWNEIDSLIQKLRYIRRYHEPNISDG